ncbi:hypothetical protein HNV11_19450 [Spirosoma taeanense]|uniref:DUF2281 domain-containing protein n=1 Tax=Spirosoma taeanense TaxID=2735870 RepID=A0A6M5YBQ8_9BACT|nr:hypothetical protein [Spirosoma taeanense]QJW91399.1 hypothetical protein HNV11_19450 [Spirosoma taeanense]
MLTAVKGTYENGQIIWHEAPPVQERTEVIVTFLESEPSAEHSSRKTGLPNQSGIRFGSLTGKIRVPADFNEPLDDLSEYM